jgi:hypothetical protein
MKKTLLIAAAALAAGVITSQAQGPVYSQNIVGYVNTKITGGNYTLCSVPLQTTNAANNAEQVLPNASAGDSVLFWNGNGFDNYTFAAPGLWVQPDSNIGPAPTLNPGQAFFYYANGSDFTNTCVGSVTLSNVTTVANGYTLCAITAPIGASMESTNVNFPLSAGDSVLLWNGNGFDNYTYAAPDTWVQPDSNIGPAPSIPVGKSFFYYNNDVSRPWTNNVVVH